MEDIPGFIGGEGAAKNKENEKERQRIKDRERTDIIFLLQFPQFRRFYWRTLSRAGVFGASFDLNSKIQDWKEGQRDIGIGLLADLNKADATAIYQMMRESMSEEQSLKPVKPKKGA